ncbi:MAG: sensor histidine kinase [Acidimicrobiales bacterium]
MGLDLMDANPEQARIALAAIKGASRDALSELRSVLGALRQADEEAPRQPTPGLGRLDELLGRSKAAGLHVVSEVEVRPRTLPTGVDLAAFRIVQEALTNVARHAGPATATVRVGYGDACLTIAGR